MLINEHGNVYKPFIYVLIFTGYVISLSCTSNQWLDKNSVIVNDESFGFTDEKLINWKAVSGIDVSGLNYFTDNLPILGTNKCLILSLIPSQNIPAPFLGCQVYYQPENIPAHGKIDFHLKVPYMEYTLFEIDIIFEETFEQERNLSLIQKNNMVFVSRNGNVLSDCLQLNGSCQNYHTYTFKWDEQAVSVFIDKTILYAQTRSESSKLVSESNKISNNMTIPKIWRICIMGNNNGNTNMDRSYNRVIFIDRVVIYKIK